VKTPDANPYFVEFAISIASSASLKLNTDVAEEAIDIANSTKYGLASGVFTSDDQKAKWTADRIQAGIIWQNDWFVDGVNLPGGGYKRSGYGRDGGVDGIYSHGQTKRISKRLV
jgi:acyl-CoA reductase-like NAD-dependent aldehyde dehydrogenase